MGNRQELYAELAAKLDHINGLANEARAFACKHDLALGTSRYEPFDLTTVPKEVLDNGSEEQWRESDASGEWIGSSVCW